MARDPQTYRKLPSPLKWRRVLVHKFVRSRTPIKVHSYSSVVTSFLSLHQGVPKPTIVTMDRYLADRAMKLGWVDITEEVAPHVTHWDEKKNHWNVGDDGLLPWEREPGSEDVEEDGVRVDEDPIDPEDQIRVPGSSPKKAEDPKPPKPRGPSRRSRKKPSKE